MKARIRVTHLGFSHEMEYDLDQIKVKSPFHDDEDVSLTKIVMMSFNAKADFEHLVKRIDELQSELNLMRLGV